jgi:hypothetical protein
MCDAGTRLCVSKVGGFDATDKLVLECVQLAVSKSGDEKAWRVNVEQLATRLLALITQGHGQKDIVVCPELPRRSAPHTRVEVTNVTVDPDDKVVEIEAITEIR